MQEFDEGLFNEISKQFYENNESFYNEFLKLILYLHKKLDFDFIYQTTPTIRFHFPVVLHPKFNFKEKKLTHHIDSMLGHPIEEINIWFPFTICLKSNSLQLTSLTDSRKILIEFIKRYRPKDFFNSRDCFLEFLHKENIIIPSFPVEMKVGEGIVFDGRCLHGPDENTENLTRISMDFRIIPLSSYEKLDRVYSAKRNGRKFTRGDVFSQNLASEIKI